MLSCYHRRTYLDNVTKKKLVNIKDYPEEMLKHPMNKAYIDWNLINTGRLLRNRFSNDNNFKQYANIFIIKADSMHLKTFARYMFI